VVAALRFAQEWVGRSEVQVLAARSRFSFGIDALGATTNSSSLPDGRFFAWLGQFQWARRLPFLGIETLIRNDTQLSSDPLFSLEQIAVGGRYSVRGYRENTLIRDNASISSLEMRIPLITGQRWADYIQIAPFFDIAYSWNTKLDTPDPRTLYSVGVGLRWTATISSPIFVRPTFEVYWGYPLKKVETQGGNLQDHGIHLQFTLALF
jgi:hemolysin activation/secretion protein